jgi:hypothetical protein
MHSHTDLERNICAGTAMYICASVIHSKFMPSTSIMHRGGGVVNDFSCGLKYICCISLNMCKHQSLGGCTSNSRTTITIISGAKRGAPCPNFPAYQTATPLRTPPCDLSGRHALNSERYAIKQGTRTQRARRNVPPRFSTSLWPIVTPSSSSKTSSRISSVAARAGRWQSQHGLQTPLRKRKFRGTFPRSALPCCSCKVVPIVLDGVICGCSWGCTC